MAYQRTYYFDFPDSGGNFYRFEMYDQGSVINSNKNREGKLGKDAVKIKYGSDGSKMFAPFKPSTLSFEFTVWDQWSAFYIKRLRQARQERDVYVALYREHVIGNNSPQYTPIWGGFLLMDLADDPDVGRPYTIQLKAVDGIASLKYYDFIPSTVSQTANHEYERKDTFMADSDNTQPTWRTFQSMIQLCLANVGAFEGTQGSPTTSATYRTATNWFNGEFTGLNVNPMTQSRVKPDVFYEKVDMGEDRDPKFKAKSCYDVLKSVCKAWGMRCVYWKQEYWFIQINMYNKLQTGTQANPEDLDNFKYKISDGTFVGFSDSIEDIWYNKYELFVDNQDYIPSVRNYKLAGGSYNILPAFKKVTIDFLNVDNNNRFNGFPPIPLTSTIGAPTISGTYYEFRSMGNFTFDGINDQEFFQRIYLNFQNGAAQGGNFNMLWTLCARVAGTGSNTPNTDPATNGWTHFYTYNYGTLTNAWRGVTYMQWWGFFVDQYFTIPTGNSTTEITAEITNGTQGEIYSLVTCPAGVGSANHPKFDAGDYEIGYYVRAYAANSSSGATLGNWQGHGQYGYGQGNNSTNPWDANLTYSDPSQSAGIGASDFAPIINGSVGSNMTTTSLVQTGDDTAFEKVNDIYFGDTGNNNSQGCIQIYTGTTNGWQPSDFAGNWGQDTLSGGNSFTQQLASDIFQAQAQNVLKFNVGTTLQPQQDWDYNDGTATRPQYFSPLTLMRTPAHTDSNTSAANWIMHTGEWTPINQEWKWVRYQVEQSTNSFTSTTTSTGGFNSGLGGGGNAGTSGPGPIISGPGFLPMMSNPGSANAAAISALQHQQYEPVAIVNVNAIIDRNDDFDTAYSQVVTSIGVQKMPQALLKSGDKILIYTASTRTYGSRTTTPPDPADKVNPFEDRLLEFTLSADQAANATSLSVVSTTIYQNIQLGDIISFSPKDLIKEYQNKTKGSIAGFDVQSDSLTKDGVKITGFIDSDSLTGASDELLPTSSSVKAYADTKQSALTLTTTGTSGAATLADNTLNIPNYASGGSVANYVNVKCSGTNETSTTEGEANAVYIPFDTKSAESTSTSIVIYGASGPEGIENAEYSFNMGTGKYEISWNVGADTSGNNNRYLAGIKLQYAEPTESRVETWNDVSPTHCYIYNRGNGDNRKGSVAGSILYNKTSSTEIYRLVIWKEDSSVSGTKALTLTNATNLIIKEV